MNQGAWYSTQHNIREVLDRKFELRYAGRPSSASPAVGYPLLHIKQLCAFVEDAIGPSLRAATKLNMAR